jgi:hypothetical protein
MAKILYLQKTMNKAIIILDAFLFYQERIEIFEKVLKKIKQIDLPILLISNTAISIDIQNQVEYFIYDKNNILFEYEYESYPFCNYYLYNGSFTWEQHVHSKQKHGLSVLCNLTKSCDFAIQQGFNKFIRFEWDFLIHDNDLNTIKNLIHNFINSDQKAFFILNPSNQQKEEEIQYYFWMVDFDFWNKKFPKIYNEIDYQNFIFNKNKNKKFNIVERFTYFTFEDCLHEMSLISPVDFVTKIAPNSNINTVTTDLSFSKENGFGINRGLTKILKNGELTGELLIMTYNRMSKTKNVNDYYITFDNQTQYFHHEVDCGEWRYSMIEGFNFSKFPITLNINNKFEKVYKTASEIENLIIFF